jgi:hypothetical protein
MYLYMYVYVYLFGAFHVLVQQQPQHLLLPRAPLGSNSDLRHGLGHSYVIVLIDVLVGINR